MSGDFEEIEATEEYSEESLNSQGEIGSIKHLQLNEHFYSYLELEQRIEEFQKLSYSYFYKRDCVTIDKCRKRGVKKYINPKLQYYRLKYCCINGGKNFKSKGTGERESSTFQKKCPAYFKLIVSSDGNSLFISFIDLHHNHQTTKQLFDHLPQARRMALETKTKVGELLNLKGDKNRIKS